MLLAAPEDLLTVLYSLQDKPLLFAWKASLQPKGFLLVGLGAGKGPAFCLHCLPVVSSGGQAKGINLQHPFSFLGSRYKVVAAAGNTFSVGAVKDEG